MPPNMLLSLTELLQNHIQSMKLIWTNQAHSDWWYSISYSIDQSTCLDWMNEYHCDPYNVICYLAHASIQIVPSEMNELIHSKWSLNRTVYYRWFILKSEFNDQKNFHWICKWWTAFNIFLLLFFYFSHEYVHNLHVIFTKKCHLND